VKLTTHLYLVPRSRISGAIPPLTLYVFMARCLIKHRDNFTFTVLLMHLHIKMIPNWNKKLRTTVEEPVRQSRPERSTNDPTPRQLNDEPSGTVPQIDRNHFVKKHE
jgi:hypothetical protein